MTHNISQQHLIIIYAIYSRSIGYIGFDFRFSGQAQENKLWQFHTRQYSGKTEILNGGWTAQFPSRPLATLTRTPGLQMRCRYLFRSHHKPHSNWWVVWVSLLKDSSSPSCSKSLPNGFYFYWPLAVAIIPIESYIWIHQNRALGFKIFREHLLDCCGRIFCCLFYSHLPLDKCIWH